MSAPISPPGPPTFELSVATYQPPIVETGTACWFTWTEGEPRTYQNLIALVGEKPSEQELAAHHQADIDAWNAYHNNP